MIILQVAQDVLYALLHIYSAERLLKLSNVETVVRGLLPYTQRHMHR